MRKKVTIGSILLMLATAGIIGIDQYYKYCAANPSDSACPTPTPTPSPSPTVEPTPSPSPTSIPTPSPTPTSIPTPTPIPPTPPPSTTACPKTLSNNAYVYMNNKRYGNGVDSSLKVHGDQQFCFLIHGVNTNDCHLEGWPRRTECEMELIGGCPIWQYQKDGVVYPCLQADHPDQSCDHWGNPEKRDDPKTPDVFEGEPVECGNQRDAAGDPMAGFFVITHGKFLVRSCLVNGTSCGPWLFGKDVK